ncbi:MAG TPA: SGNH/GDSL hydrolase family protein [Solirubrobacteraceae bacterium]
MSDRYLSHAHVRGRRTAGSRVMRPMLSIAAAVAALMAFAAAPSIAGASTPYVSLGDSYTSGPFILPPAPGAPLECLQSARNYPHLAASALGLSLKDVSCSGATTENITTTAQYSSQPPQIDALSSTTQVVSVGIGGNDKGLFLNTLITCGAEDLVFPFGTPCKSTYGHKLAEEIAEDGPVIGAMLHQVHTVSPSAKVFVVGYPDILPQSGNCWPTVPLTTGDTAYLNGVEKELNSMLSSEAAANGDTYVDTYTPSIGHDACKSLSVRYVEPVLPESDAFSVHPNERGMEADASEVEAAMRAKGIS